MTGARCEGLCGRGREVEKASQSSRFRRSGGAPAPTQPVPTWEPTEDTPAIRAISESGREGPGSVPVAESHRCACRRRLHGGHCHLPGVPPGLEGPHTTAPHCHLLSTPVKCMQVPPPAGPNPALPPAHSVHPQAGERGRRPSSYPPADTPSSVPLAHHRASICPQLVPASPPGCVRDRSRPCAGRATCHFSPRGSAVLPCPHPPATPCGSVCMSNCI